MWQLPLIKHRNEAVSVGTKAKAVRSSITDASGAAFNPYKSTASYCLKAVALLIIGQIYILELTDLVSTLKVGLEELSGLEEIIVLVQSINNESLICGR